MISPKLLQGFKAKSRQIVPVPTPIADVRAELITLIDDYWRFYCNPNDYSYLETRFDPRSGEAYEVHVPGRVAVLSPMKSAKLAIDFLKPVVLALARLFEIAFNCLEAAVNPVSGVRSMVNPEISSHNAPDFRRNNPTLFEQVSCHLDGHLISCARGIAV